VHVTKTGGETGTPKGALTRHRHAVRCTSNLNITSTELRAGAARYAKRHDNAPVVPRNEQQIRRFFDGFELVESGLVHSNAEPLNPAGRGDDR
jgi:hypothetical protein